MLNAYPLNTLPLNTISGSDAHETIPIEPPENLSHVWQVTVTVGGLDVTDRLTQTVTVDREESASGIAEFILFYPPGEAVPVELHDSEVQITYTAELDGHQVQGVLFTGWVTEPSWSATSRTMRVLASDLLQARVEAMAKSEIEQLTAGQYSEDVFGEVEDHWQYAQDRMSTRTAALDCNTLSEMRVTDWEADPVPHYLFSAGSTVYQSADVQLAQPDTVIGTLELSLQYRYQRLHRSTETFRWTHSAAPGESWGNTGFCAWRPLTTDMPTKDMVLSAVSSAGLAPVSADWGPLPPTAPDPCGNGQPWINRFYPDLLIGFEVEGVRQWTQAVTESYTLTLKAESGRRTERARASASVQAPAADTWSTLEPDENGLASLPDTEPGDQPDESRRQEFISTALSRAAATLIDSHRQAQVSWQCPTALTLGIDTAHTLELNDQHAHASGKCVRRLDELNLETGSALTTLSIAVSRGGGTSDPLEPPPRPGAGGASSHTSETLSLPSQFGGRFDSPPEYSEDLDGFSGMYAAVQDSTLAHFPRRLAVTAAEYSEDYTDELSVGQSALYLVGAPLDILEL